MSKIPELRNKIDSIDSKVLELLEERAGYAKEIGDEKRASLGKTGTPGFYDPEREQNVIQRLTDKSKDSFPKKSVPLVFREIMSACRSLEADIRVGYLGPPGTYTQIATFQSFGHSVDHVEAATIEGVFDLVSRGETEYGLVPFENSCEGGVIQTLDAFLRYENVVMRRELAIPIRHCLVTLAENIPAIKKVYSHPAALAQCRQWIGENLRGAELVATKSTSYAAQVAKGDPTAAAIASELSAELLGMNILRAGIEDQKNNSTRFAVICMQDAPATGKDMTSLAISFGSGASGLGSALDIFQKRGLAVRRVESRANSHDFWHYFYFVDFEGHRSDANVAAALKDLAALATKIRLIGSYPRVIER